MADTSPSGDANGDDDGETSNDSPDGQADDDDEATMEANISSSDKGKVHPAALARMMGTNKPKKPAIKKGTGTRAANTVSWSTNTVTRKVDPPMAGADAPSGEAFMGELENWGTSNSDHADLLDTIGQDGDYGEYVKDSKDDMDSDPFNLKALMSEGEGPDFW